MERLTFLKTFDNESTLRNAARVDNHIMHREPIESRFFDSHDELNVRPILGYKHYLCGEVIDKLAEYEDAEEQGLLLRLPCPIGTTVFVVIEECEEMYEPDNTYFAIYTESFHPYMLDCIGKDVFLTEEEAFAASQKKQEDNA